MKSKKSAQERRVRERDGRFFLIPLTFPCVRDMRQYDDTRVQVGCT